jgi:hypothetical protein
VDCVVRIAQSIIRPDMNRRCDFARRRFNAPNGAGRLQGVSHLDAEINVHYHAADFWVVIEEQIVTGTRSIVGFQEGPNLIECGLPCPGNAAARYVGPDTMPILVRRNAGLAEVHLRRRLQHGNSNLYPFAVALIDNGITLKRKRHLGRSRFRRRCGLHGVSCP